MRQLLIDRGNTATKWQVIDNAVLLKAGVGKNSDSLADLFADVKSECFSAIYVSSVASDDFKCCLNDWSKQCGHAVPVFVESSSKACGVNNVYAKPSELGVDRWLAMIAAHKKYDGMLCVVDSGTAMTMDFVLGSGEHLGGFIVPGAELMKSSLLLNTDKIKVGDVTAKASLGVSTIEAVTLGIEQMLRAFIEAKLLDISNTHQQSVTLVLTGGHADILAESLSCSFKLEKDLVLQGLKIMFEQNG